MDKKRMVKRLIEGGVLVSPDVLKEINESDLDGLMRGADIGAVFTGKQKEETEKKVRVPPRKEVLLIQVRETERKNKLVPKDFIGFQTKKFETLRSMLLQKMSAISINNAKTTDSGVSVIGVIKSKTSSGFFLEDMTGEIEVISNNPNTGAVLQDDVLGVRGLVRGGKMLANELVFPDIPLTHPIGRIDAMFTLTPNKDETTVSCGGQALKLKSLPARMVVLKEGKGFTILIHNTNATSEQAAWLLKKRYLPHGKNILNPDNPFIIDPLPDILWLISTENWAKTYKGVTLISTKQGTKTTVNLYTREVSFEA